MQLLDGSGFSRRSALGLGLTAVAGVMIGKPAVARGYAGGILEYFAGAGAPATP